MKSDQVATRIGNAGVVAVLRAVDADEATRTVEAIFEGGISVVEITMTVPGAPLVIHEIARRYGREVLVGAGTVVTANQAKSCVDAGAEFLVSPGLSYTVLSAAWANDKLLIPGILTPTELLTAHAHQVNVFKVFPCESVGGPKYLRHLKASFPDIRMVPMGGVNASNACEYIAAGAFALGVDADLLSPLAVHRGDKNAVTRAARELVEVVRSSRTKSL